MRFHPNLELRWLKKPDETSSWDFGLRWHTTAGIWGIYVWCLVKPEGGWDVSGILWWFNQNLDWFIAILCWYSDTPTKIDTGRVTIWEFDFTFLCFFFLNVFFFIFFFTSFWLLGDCYKLMQERDPTPAALIDGGRQSKCGIHRLEESGFSSSKPLDRGLGWIGYIPTQSI